MPKPRSKPVQFPLGKLYITPAAQSLLTPHEVQKLLQRHKENDWGDMCESDVRTNDAALYNGGRIFSSYHLDAEREIWVITEANRSVTTVLLPEDY